MSEVAAPGGTLEGAPIGRETILAALQPRLDALVRGAGSLILISGEAGIGKSILAEALLTLAGAGGAVTAIGRSYEGELAPPFGPWSELIERLAARLDPASEAAAVVAALPPPFGSGAGAATPFQLFRAVAGALREVAVWRPVAVLVEDLHWADRDALDLLEVATRRLDDRPLLVIATLRTSQPRPGHPLSETVARLHRDRPLERVALDRLSAEDGARLITARLGRCDPTFIARLLTRAEGHPLLLTQILRDLEERDLLVRDAAGIVGAASDLGSLSPALRHLLVARAGRLGADARALLDVAAVGGEVWELPVVEAVLAWPEERVLAALEEALEAGLILPRDGHSEGYRFEHGLLREALLDGQLARRRRRLHAALCEVLSRGTGTDDQPERVAALAHHAAAAEEWPAAARYALAAGDAARERRALHAAARHYAAGLEALDRGGEIEAALRRALPERLGQVALTLNQLGVAESAFQRLRAVAAAEGDSAAAARALAAVSLARQRAGSFAGAGQAVAAAREAAGARAGADLQALLDWTRGHHALVTGDLAVAGDYLTRAERLARESGQHDLLGRTLQYLAQQAIWAGRYEAAADAARESVTLTMAGDDLLHVAGALWRLGIALGERGDYAAAGEALREGLARADALGDLHYLVRLQNTLGWLALEMGDVAAARAWDERSLAGARGSGDGGDRIAEAERYALVNLATDALAAGDLAGAGAWLDELDAMLDRSVYARFRYENRYQIARAELALARGELDAARRWAGAARRAALEKGMPKNVVRADLLDGRALLVGGAATDALAPLGRAVTLADEIAHGSLGWRTRYWLGRAQLVAHQRAAAVSFAAALTRIEHLAAGLPEGEPRQTFLAAKEVATASAAATGVPQGIQSSEPAIPAGLSAREVEVLRLVSGGATNAAVAAALSISVKTVDAHMTSILNKTGAANRAAAVAFAHRHGLVARDEGDVASLDTPRPATR